ncbi:MAG: anti-sigma factor antagonist [Chloroflexi bacterium]|nr:MAG: anti-sigma factor antagonist [Chloroflexota bacterium]
MVIVASQAMGNVSVSILKLIGDLNDEEPLTSQSQTIINGGTRHILLDLSEVPFISSAGLRAIHSVYTLLSPPESPEEQKARRMGIAAGTYTSSHLKLLNPTKHGLKALQVSGYDMFLAIYNDQTEALASF